MCFSASVSFGAGAVLTVIGVATIKKTQHRSQLLFASIPFIFGLQQLTEGVLWMTLPNPNYITIQRIFTYLYLFFAQILWPIWVPIAILIFEKSVTRNRIQKILAGIGVFVGVILAYFLLTYQVEASIIGYHISYKLAYPESLKYYGVVLYAVATIGPPFFSHIKRMWLLGATILISYIVTMVFYEQYVLSVWCFFSSIISLSIYAIVLESKGAKNALGYIRKKAPLLP